jgi:sulfite reductase alpha subunit-like flavoprotein
MKQSFQPGIFDMHVAFSREGSKVYVQHLIERQAQEIKELVIEQGACVYICGDANPMAKDVLRKIAQVLAKHERFSGDVEEAEIYLKELKRVGRWSEDVW